MRQQNQIVPMRYELSFQRDRDVVEVRAFGKGSVEGFARLDIELVEHPHWTPGMRVLFDFRELDLVELTAKEIRASSDFVRGLSDRLGSARFSCVVGSEVDYGIARMFEMMTSDATQLEIRIFRSLSEGWSWLLSRAPSRSS